MTNAAAAKELNQRYARNCWWVAALGREVTSKPLGRWLLGERVVLYRTSAGQIAALEDRCAHRWAPLSQGEVIGDDIACPYHGFRFNTLGACTMIPVQDRIPRGYQVRSFPVLERASFIWIWMGDATQADPALIPKLPWFSDESFTALDWYVGEIECNYMIVQENVLDLTHVAYLHKGTLLQGREHSSEPGSAVGPIGSDNVIVRSNSVTVHWTEVETPAADFLARQVDVAAGKPLNFATFSTFVAPGTHLNGVEITDSSPEPGARRLFRERSLHCSTPISSNRCHYFHARAQDYGQQVADLPGFSDTWVAAVLKEDVQIMEAIQATIDSMPEGSGTLERLVRTDRPIVEARRLVRSLVDAEESLAPVTTPGRPRAIKCTANDPSRRP